MKNRYCLNSKISEDTFRTIVLYFLCGAKILDTQFMLKGSNKLPPLSDKTLRATFDTLRVAIFENEYLRDLIFSLFEIMPEDIKYETGLILFAQSLVEDFSEQKSSELSYCLFNCPFGPSVRDVRHEFSLAYDTTDRLFSMFAKRPAKVDNLDKFAEAGRLAAKVAQRTRCPDCKCDPLKYGTPRMWRTLSDYMSDYRSLTDRKLIYVFYNSVIRYNWLIFVAHFHHKRQIREFGLSLEAVSPDFDKAAIEQRFREDQIEFFRNSVFPLFRLNKRILEYFAKYPIGTPQPYPDLV